MSRKRLNPTSVRRGISKPPPCWTDARFVSAGNADLLVIEITETPEVEATPS